MLSSLWVSGGMLRCTGTKLFHDWPFRQRRIAELWTLSIQGKGGINSSASRSSGAQSRNSLKTSIKFKKNFTGLSLFTFYYKLVSIKNWKSLSCNHQQMPFNLKRTLFSTLGSLDQFFGEENKEELKRKCLCVYSLGRQVLGVGKWMLTVVSRWLPVLLLVKVKTSMSLDPDLLPQALWDNFKPTRQMTHFLNPFNVMNPSGDVLKERGWKLGKWFDKPGFLSDVF